MASLGMGDTAYDYNSEMIKKIVDTKKGNYALGSVKNNTFYPKYVGRSDVDLQAELIAHLNDKGHLKQFKLSYAPSKQEAFEKECTNYHDFEDSLENENHPDSPNGMNLECPICHN